MTREELLNRGMSHQEVDAMTVQMHQQDILRGHIARWAMFFMCILCIMGPTWLGLLLWLILSWNNARHDAATCDAPLIEWVTTVYILKVYLFVLHKYVIKCIFKYDSSAPDRPPLPPPWYVKLYNFLLLLFDFIWNIVGLALVGGSTTCHANMPEVHNSVLAFASCSLFVTVWFVINSIGLHAVLGYMMRNGMLHDSGRAAPGGTLEKQPVVPYVAEDFADNPTCSVCLDDFNAQVEIRKLPCGHCFHTKCLKGWLNMNRNCPLCRADLLSGAVVGRTEEP